MEGKLWVSCGSKCLLQSLLQSLFQSLLQSLLQPRFQPHFQPPNPDRRKDEQTNFPPAPLSHNPQHPNPDRRTDKLDNYVVFYRVLSLSVSSSVVFHGVLNSSVVFYGILNLSVIPFFSVCLHTYLNAHACANTRPYLCHYAAICL